MIARYLQCAHGIASTVPTARLPSARSNRPERAVRLGQRQLPDATATLLLDALLASSGGSAGPRNAPIASGRSLVIPPRKPPYGAQIEHGGK